jgi:hypothetical protein
MLLSMTVATLNAIAIGNNKTLMVDYFGSNIFRIDEDTNKVFEREVDLLEYASSRGYQNLILKRIDEIEYGNNNLLLFPKWARPSFSRQSSDWCVLIGNNFNLRPIQAISI